MPENHEKTRTGLSRRQMLTAGGASILATAATAATAIPASAATTTSADPSAAGTPEQIHLTWGDDPARAVVVSWASPGQAIRPRVLIGRDLSFYINGYSNGEQTRWLEETLRDGRQDPSVDWIIVQMHQCPCSSSKTGNGSDAALRAAWVPLFDQYQVDLVLSGHDHDYERSLPTRGIDHNAGTVTATGATVDTWRPHPVTTVDTGTFDTSQGTVYLILGCGGTSANLDIYGFDTADGDTQARVFIAPNRPIPSATPGTYLRVGAQATEDAIWSANRDTATGYGIAVFDVDPGGRGDGKTSITVTQYHALGADPVNPTTGAKGAPTSDYTVFETFTPPGPPAQ
jgi:Calcineurin-like phosphoesterase